MDGMSFDRFSRTLAAGISRRRAVAAALGIGAAALTGIDRDAAAARCRPGRGTCSRNSQCCSGTCRTGRGVPVADRNRCACEGGTVNCNGRCVDKKTDPRNCGACGNVCAAGQVCSGSACIVPTPCMTMTAGKDLVCIETGDGDFIFISTRAKDCMIFPLDQEEAANCALGTPCPTDDSVAGTWCAVSAAVVGEHFPFEPTGTCVFYFAGCVADS